MKILSLIALAFFLTACAKTPEQTAAEFLGNLKSGDYVSAESSLSDKYQATIKEWHGGLTIDNLKEFYKAGNLESFTLSPVFQDELKSKYKVTITTISSSKHTSYIKLVNQNGEWKVSSF